MKRNLLLASIALTANTLLAQANYQKTTDGVIIQLQQNASGAKLLQLSVVNNKTIQVKATVENAFSTEKSLITVKPFDSSAKWHVSTKGDSLYLKTTELTAAVSLKSGEIAFADKNGKRILSESKGDGKSFAPITVEGTKGFTIRQKFNSTDDEAFYGLGQHQSDEFNYKGKNETLYQYNTKVSVPFVISNKNYGILWDNYSLSKFGDKRDYSQMSLFKLYDKEGKAGGLTATYYTNSDTNKVFCKRLETCINYENLDNQKDFPSKFLSSGSNVTWEGSIEPTETGIFRFLLYYAGYTKVYINNQLVVAERWRTAWNPNSYKFSVDLKAGIRVPIRIEWKFRGDTYIGLKVLSPVAAEEQNKLALWSEMGNEINYYFIAGKSMDEVISGYRNITGKAPIMPAWAMGFWQSRERYKTQDEIVGTLKEFRQRQIPIDNIVMDWFYWKEDQWGSQEFDPKRFQNPTKMISDIHGLNGHIMISVWPKFYANTQHYKEFDKNGWMYQRATNDSVRDWVGKGHVGSFYDAYSEGARKLFWNQMNEHLFSKGIDAWWMDASEPDIQSNSSIEYRKALCGPTALGPSTKYFNTYALMNAKAIYEGQRGIDPNKRVFLLTRSGFAGLQRYSTATWSGDIGTRWEDMKAQISAGLNYAMSGVPYWTMDIGGFCVENRYEKAQQLFDSTKIENSDLKEWRELNARWYQFGTFAPLFRAHGQFPLREVYNIAPENHSAYKSFLYYNKLRYSLMPYIYTLAGMTNYKDYTIMRALVMDHGKDSKVNNISDQFMFGPSLMICPVYKYEAREREVYFPATSGWYDFYTGKFVAGNQTKTVAAPYERMPIFVPEGAIIPFGPDIQYVGEKKPDNLTVYVYAGRNGSFELYEDEGVNYNYEKGQCSKIRFTYNDKTRILTIRNRTGSFNGMLQKRTFNIVYVNKQNAASFDLKNQKGKAVIYNGEKLTIKL